jgi:hypothetical protein
MDNAVSVEPYRFKWVPAISAGVIGGAFFIGLQMLLIWVFQGKSPYGPEHAIAAIALGWGYVPHPPPPPGVVWYVFVVGLLIHFALSIFFGIILTWMIDGSKWLNSLLIGVTFGFTLYFIDFYLFVRVFPWFAMSRGAITIATHTFYGLTVAIFYKILTRPVSPVWHNVTDEG